MQNYSHISSELHRILIDEGIEAISVVDAEKYTKSIEKFEKILENQKFSYAIHHILKVNHSKKLLETAKNKNLRADVSSLGELEQAISVEYSAENITTNGPKNKKFLQKSIELGTTIAVDSIEELEKIIAYAHENQKKIPIIIRLGSFPTAIDTRFGVAKWLWKLSLSLIKENRDFLDVLGYHFHIDIPDVLTRIDVFWEAIEYYKGLLSIGIQPKIIDIGGSYGTTYENNISWDDKSTQNAMHKMYTNNEYTGANFLEMFLTKESKGKSSIAQFLFENNITLWIEPGRAMLSENVGFVATTVLGTREDSLIVNTNSFALGMREEELPTNPLLLDDDEDEKKEKYFFLGNLCLESDMIYSRTIPFARRVQEDDIIIFPNMASYHMDFYETEAIAHPKKKKYFLENNTLYPDI